jgi:hypothetical protein
VWCDYRRSVPPDDDDTARIISGWMDGLTDRLDDTKRHQEGIALGEDAKNVPATVVAAVGRSSPAGLLLALESDRLKTDVAEAPLGDGRFSHAYDDDALLLSFGAAAGFIPTQLGR